MLSKSIYRFDASNAYGENDKNIAAIGAKADELLKWNELLDKGAITQEEYDKAKRDLLS